MGNAIDKVFKNALHNHKVQPSPDLWAKMEGALDAKEKAPKMVYWNYAIAAVLILLIGIPAFMVVQDQGSQLYVERVESIKLSGAEPNEPLPPLNLSKESVAAVTPKKILAVKKHEETHLKEKEVAITEQEIAPVKTKKVIQAFARPITSLASIAPTASETEVMPVKEKVTVKTVFNKLKELKRGELNLPRNISVNLPKPELFASK